MDKKKFKKQIEDFICEKCGKQNIGNGYTNHCYNCLWSKHVDVNPGDREETCGGLMKPANLFKKDGEFFIEHICEKCGFIRNKKAVKGDNFDELVKIMAKVK
ncbi:MAG: RNHCP domain-containing protein [bacterium]|nr:RNHCP domain-containing protein [bacterium]